MVLYVFCSNFLHILCRKRCEVNKLIIYMCVCIYIYITENWLNVTMNIFRVYAYQFCVIDLRSVLGKMRLRQIIMHASF